MFANMLAGKLYNDSVKLVHVPDYATGKVLNST